MNYGETRYIWQAADWPNWRYDLSALARLLTEVSHAQGVLLGRLADVGLALRDQASLAVLTEDVVKTSEIEGELTSSKWAVIAKCSPDTALRDITQLLALGVLKKSPGGGRSTGYELTRQ